MLYVSLGFSAFLLVVVNAIALSRRKEGVGRASLFGLAATVLFFWATMLALSLNALLVAVVGAVCWAVRPGAAGSWRPPSAQPSPLTPSSPCRTCGPGTG